MQHARTTGEVRAQSGEPETWHHWQHYTAGAEVPHLLVNNVPTIMTNLRELEPLSYSESRKSSLTTPAEGEEGET